MLRRFGAWMYCYRRGFAVAVLAAGVLTLLLTHGCFRGVEMAFWQSQAQPCGTLSHWVRMDGPGSSGDPQAATTCFMQTYAHCQVATLVTSFSGVDTSDRDTFVIEPVLFAGGAHPCSIQVNLARRGVLAQRFPNDDWVTCAGVDQRSDGLHFSGCGAYGDLFVGSA